MLIVSLVVASWASLLRDIPLSAVEAEIILKIPPNVLQKHRIFFVDFRLV